MRVLLDTHVFLWWINDDPRLSTNAREVIVDGENDLLFSVASVWEMAIKQNLGKLSIEGSLGPYLTRYLTDMATVVPVSLRHAVSVAELPNLHRDPFDRLLVAQALVEEVPLVSGDVEVSRYPVETIW